MYCGVAMKQAGDRPGRQPAVPASAFSIVLGLAGIGNSWRVAGGIWHVPWQIGEAIMAVAGVVWVVLLLGTVAQLLFWRGRAAADRAHPAARNFTGLIGVATMLMANGLHPYCREGALALLCAGAAASVSFGVWQTGSLWRADHDTGWITASLYLPTVAGSFLAGTMASSFGFRDWGQLAFGAGLCSWLAIESVVVQRLYGGGPLDVAQRPSLDIQFAPPAVAAVTYLSLTDGAPDLMAHILVGYALLQVLVIARLMRWICRHPFALSYWGFTFGAASLATATLEMVGRGERGPVAAMAPVLFAGANALVGAVFAGSLGMAARQGLRWFGSRAGSPLAAH